MPHVNSVRTYHSNRDTKGSAFTDIANHLAGISYAIADYFEDPDNAVFISKFFYGTMLIFLLGMAGVMSGLTLALFTLDIRRLKGYTTGSSLRLKRQALRVIPLLENPHWTLCTLLTCNAAAVETLPLVLDHMVHTLTAIVLSVVLVLVFGEILPQAFFARYALQVSSFFAGFVGILMIITSPVSWTFGWVLDVLVGHKQHSLLRRTELKQLLRLRRRHQRFDKVVAKNNHLDREMDLHHSPQPHGPVSELSALVGNTPVKRGSRSMLATLKRWSISRLPSRMRGSLSVSSSDSDNDDDPEKALQATVKATSKKLAIEDNEMKIMLGALSLSELQTKDVMPAKVNNIFFLEKDEEITKDVVAAVFNHGFSRIPVFCSERKEFTSYFLARSLICFIYPQATWSDKSSSGTMEILKRKRARLDHTREAGSKPNTNEWIASQPTLVQDLPQHEALYCSADTMLGEVYEDLITLNSPIVFVLKSEEEHPPPQLDHTGNFSDYGTMGHEEDLGMSFTTTLARQKVMIADPHTPLMAACQGVQTYSSKAHGVFSGPSSMAVSPEPLHSCTSLPSACDSDDPMTPARDHHRFHHFQQRYLKLVEEGPTSGMLTFEDVVEVVHGISVVDEFDWESHGRIQSEWRDRLAVARVVQRGSSFIKPPHEGTRDRSLSLGTDGDVSRRLLHNLGLDSTTRTSEAFNFSFSRHAKKR